MAKTNSIRDFELPDGVIKPSSYCCRARTTHRHYRILRLPDQPLLKVAGFIVFSGCKSYSAAFEAIELPRGPSGSPVYEKYAGAEDGPSPGRLATCMAGRLRARSRRSRRVCTRRRHRRYQEGTRRSSTWKWSWKSWPCRRSRDRSMDEMNKNLSQHKRPLGQPLQHPRPAVAPLARQ